MTLFRGIPSDHLSFHLTAEVKTEEFISGNRLSRIEHKQNANMLNVHDYVFDNLSRITSVKSKIGPVDGNGQPRPVNFTYDARSQMLSADDGTLPSRPGSQSFSYTYDNNGNRSSTGYTAPTDNRLKTGPGETYEYDLEGKLTRISDGSVTKKLLTRDHRNRLTKVETVSGGTVNTVLFSYDAFNRLVARSESATGTTWGYDDGINPLLESDGQLGRTHRYLWSNQVDDLLADEQNPAGTGWNTLWALSDHQGTVKDLLDYNPSTGVSTLANSRTYDAFGNLESQSGYVTTPFGYTGKYFDQSTGLQNSLNRWYSPAMGRFISQDPIGLASGDANLYRYVGNEATGATDPSGLQDVQIFEVEELNSTSKGANARIQEKLLPLPEELVESRERQLAFLSERFGKAPIALPFPPVITEMQTLPWTHPNGKGQIIPLVGTIDAKNTGRDTPNVINLYGDHENPSYPDYAADPIEEFGRPNTKLLPSDSVDHIVIRNSPLHFAAINMDEITRVLKPGGTITFSGGIELIQPTLELFRADYRIIDIQRPFSYKYGTRTQVVGVFYTLQARSKN